DDKIIALNHVRIFDDRKSLSVLAREKFNPAISLLECLVAAAVLSGSHFREPRDKSATGAITPTSPRACSGPACSKESKDISASLEEWSGSGSRDIDGQGVG